MKAATERKIIRWFHIITSIPVVGYIYGPVKNFPNAVMAIKWVLFPLIILTGLWMWKGHLLKKWFRKNKFAAKRISTQLLNNEQHVRKNSTSSGQ